MSRHSAVFLFVAAALCATIVAAQDTNCKGLPPLKDSQSGYQKRSDRCEGLYVANVGSHSLTAMSFSLGKIRFDLNPLVKLQVSAPGQKEPVNIRAVAIPPKTYYRMDAGLPAGATMVWPVRDVLMRENLSGSRIGIFGRKGPETAKTLVPLRVVPQDKAVTPAPLFLTIEASFDAQVVKVGAGAEGRVSGLRSMAERDRASRHGQLAHCH